MGVIVDGTCPPLYFTRPVPCGLFPCAQTVGLAKKVRDTDLVFVAADPASGMTVGRGKNPELDTAAKRSGEMAWRR